MVLDGCLRGDGPSQQGLYAGVVWGFGLLGVGLVLISLVMRLGGLFVTYVSPMGRVGGGGGWS